MKTVFVFLVFCLGLPFAQATGVSDAFNAQREVLYQIRKGRLNLVTQLALNQIVAKAVYELEYRGYSEDAERIEREWHDQFLNHFAAYGTMDLGDHAPLMQWLADTYDFLENTLGLRLMSGAGLTDIRVFNFSIPVVFQPRGDARNGDSWDRAEYRRHFVPFTGGIVFWVSWGACVGVLGNNWLGITCKPAAGLLRWATEMWVAPGLSDKIYGRPGTPRASS